jgi:hypothetical protein
VKALTTTSPDNRTSEQPWWFLECSWYTSKRELESWIGIQSWRQYASELNGIGVLFLMATRQRRG